MMSNSEDETLSNICQTKSSNVRFVDEARPSNAHPTTPSTPGTDATSATNICNQK